MRIYHPRFQKPRKMDEELERQCIQCGRCGGVCPIGHVRSEISPRKTLFRITQDKGKRLDEDKDELWMCVTCYACDEICPQGIKLVNVMFETRNYLCRSDETPDSIKEMLKILKKEGRAVPATAETRDMRKDLGLEDLRKPDVRGLLKISNLQ